MAKYRCQRTYVAVSSVRLDINLENEGSTNTNTIMRTRTLSLDEDAMDVPALEAAEVVSKDAMADLPTSLRKISSRTKTNVYYGECNNKNKDDEYEYVDEDDDEGDHEPTTISKVTDPEMDYLGDECGDEDYYTRLILCIGRSCWYETELEGVQLVKIRLKNILKIILL